MNIGPNVRVVEPRELPKWTPKENLQIPEQPKKQPVSEREKEKVLKE